MTENFWNERYAGSAFMYGTEPNDFLRDHASVLSPSGDVLCVAEGEGRNAVFLASKGHRVTGVDGSSEGVEKARGLARGRGLSVSFELGDLATWALGEAKWDAVVSIWAHLPEALRRDLHPRIAASVRPGGLVLFEHYHPKQMAYKTGGPPDPTMMLTLDELRQAFAGWSEVFAFEGERHVEEGTGHRGLSYVTQFIARSPL